MERPGGLGEGGRARGVFGGMGVEDARAYLGEREERWVLGRLRRFAVRRGGGGGGWAEGGAA